MILRIRLFRRHSVFTAALVCLSLFPIPGLCSETPEPLLNRPERPPRTGTMPESPPGVVVVPPLGAPGVRVGKTTEIPDASAPHESIAPGEQLPLELPEAVLPSETNVAPDVLLPPLEEQGAIPGNATIPTPEDQVLLVDPQPTPDTDAPPLSVLPTEESVPGPLTDALVTPDEQLLPELPETVLPAETNVAPDVLFPPVEVQGAPPGNATLPDPGDAVLLVDPQLIPDSHAPPLSVLPTEEKSPDLLIKDSVPGPAVGQNEIAPQSTEPLTIPQGATVYDATGNPVAIQPDGATVLPDGGRIVDEQGRVIVVQPGGRVQLPKRPLTPGDFLPKAAKEAPPEQPAPPKEKQGKDIPKKTPRPEAPRKQKQEKEPPVPAQKTKSKSGERFEIPQEACDNRTLDFLAGCWRGLVTLTGGQEVVIRLCYDTNGNGKRTTEYLRRGLTCSGASKARWGANQLSFTFKELYCSNGEQRTDIPIVCEGCGETTRCMGTEYSNDRMTGKTNFEMTRE